jgi:hypothetical protein
MGLQNLLCQGLDLLQLFAQNRVIVASLGGGASRGDIECLLYFGGDILIGGHEWVSYTVDGGNSPIMRDVRLRNLSTPQTAKLRQSPERGRMRPQGGPSGGYRALFSFRQAVVWAKQQRLAKISERKSMFVIDRAERQRHPRGKAAIALGAA